MLHRAYQVIGRTIALAAYAALIAGASAPARAFDQVIHHSLVYAAAIANGMPPPEAAIVANASFSLDKNDTTIAFSETLLPAELMDALRGLPIGKELPRELAERFIELPHMRSGQVFHALTTPENRRIIQEAHLRRINRALTSSSEPGTPDQRRRRALLYLGEYLHFVGDTVVHPNDPLLGHGPGGHTPDRGDLNREAVMRALALFAREITAFRQSGATRTQIPVQPLPRDQKDSYPPLPARLGSTELNHRLALEAGNAVADSWERTYVGYQSICNAALTAVGQEEVLGDILETERAMRAASEVNRVIAQAFPRQPDVHRNGIFHKYVLDSDGEVLAICRQPPDGDCSYADANAMFGGRSIEILPFANTLADMQRLKDERRSGVLAFLRTLPVTQEYYKARGLQLLLQPKAVKKFSEVCAVKRAVEIIEQRPPAQASPAEVAQLRMSSANMVVTMQQTVQAEQNLTRSMAAAVREPDPVRRATHETEAKRAREMRDGLMVGLAQRAAVPVAPPRQNSALEFGRSETLELLRRMDQQYKREGAGDPLGTFLQNYDGAARRAAGEINRNPGTQFFVLPQAARPTAGAAPPTIPPPPPPPVPVAGGREPGGIKFSSARAAELAATIDISSIAFDAARGRIVVSGGKGQDTFDLDMFADLLRLAVEVDEPFFSLDPADSVAFDNRSARLIAEIDRKYPQGENLVEAIVRAAPPPLIRGNRRYYYTTVEALDPDLAARAAQGQNLAVQLVFSPAWLRYSKVGKVLYEADLAIKAVATGFVETEGGLVPVPQAWGVPEYEPLWLQPGPRDGGGRANFELSKAKVALGQGKVDLSSVHPGLYFTQRAAGTNRDLPPSPADLALSAHFEKHWQLYADSVPEIGRLVTVFRAYVAARFLVENHPGLKTRILSFARDLPPEQPPISVVYPTVLRIAMEGEKAVPLSGNTYASLNVGFSGGIVFGVDKKDGGTARIVPTTTMPAEGFWRGLFAAAWYDGAVDTVVSASGTAVALDFEGGDMPFNWHLRLVFAAAMLSLGLAGVALLLRRFDWQRTELATTCRHCAAVHRKLGSLATASDMVGGICLGYLMLLPLAASAYESGADWRAYALSAALLVLLFGVLILIGLVLRAAFDFSRGSAPRSIGILSAMPGGARFAGAVVALLLLYRGMGRGDVGGALALLLGPAVAERTFAMAGGAGPVVAAALVLGAATLLGFACRWLLPRALGSRPLALFSFTDTHSHGHQAP